MFAANACTEVDDNLGNNLIPINQQMKLRVEYLEGVNESVKTYTFKQDSLVSSGLGYVYFGQERNATFGKRKNGFILQYQLASLPYETGYGLNPIVDSLYLYLPLSTVNGDTTKVQKFDVYAIDWNDSAVFPNYIQSDSTYRTSYDVEPIKKAKLFNFQHTGKRSVGARLFPTAEGTAYLRELVELDIEKYPIDNDSMFRTKFKGLYVTPSDDSPVEAATYSADLSNAYMALCVRNHDSVDVSAIYDTVASLFMFYDKALGGKNASVNLVEFEYTGTPVQDALTKTEMGQTQSVTYVQTMGGVGTKLEFTDEIIEKLRNLRNQVENGEAKRYPSIMINQAEMYLRLDGNASDYMYLNNSVKRLGSYLNPNILSTTPDYLYYYEASMQSSDKTYVLPYDGYLNRSNGYYRLDITSYVQQLAKEVAEGAEPAIAPVIYLAPEVYGYYGFGETTLKGFESDNPISIRLTYTLIDERDKK